MKRLFLSLAIAALALPSFGKVVSGTASGTLTVGETKTQLRYSYVVEKNTLLKLVLSEKKVDDAAFADSSSLEGYLSDGKAIEIQLNEEKGAEEVFFFHPDIPAGLSVREVTKFTPRLMTSSRVGGQVVFDDPGFSFGFNATFEAPVTHMVSTIKPLPPDATPAEHARWRLEQLEIPYDESTFRQRVMGGDADVVKLFLEAGMPVETEDALKTAVEFGHVKVVKTLIDAGANVNYVGEYNQSLVMNAASAGKADIIKALIDGGADVNIANSYRITPLAAAAEQGHLDIVKMLLGAKAKVNARDPSGGTALSVAVLRGYGEIVQTLIDAGADVQRDKKDLLEYAKDKPEIRKMIEAAAAKTKKK